MRRRGLFLAAALLWAAAGAFLITVGAALAVLLERGLALVERLRPALGLQPPAAGPDWLLVALLAAVALLLAALVAVAWRSYRRAWRRRLGEVWESRRERRRFGRWRRPGAPSAAGRQRQLGYLAALLGSAAWRERWPELRAKIECPAGAIAQGGPAGVESDLPGPDELQPGDAEAASETLLVELEAEVAERAIATGLIVGLSPNRVIDSLTIVAAAFEIQLHVLTRLGKRPSWRSWPLLLQRCGASLFANSYLNRSDALALSFAVKKAALGIHAASHLAEEGADLVAELDIEEALDDLLGEGVLPESLQPFLTATVAGTGFGLGVGSVGLRLIGQAVETIGDDLLQGVLAGGALYFHGIALAADVLAVDRRHRTSPAMTRSFLACARAVVAAAGLILREQITARRRALRQRRREALKQTKNLPGAAARRLWPFGRKGKAS